MKGTSSISSKEIESQSDGGDRGVLKQQSMRGTVVVTPTGNSNQDLSMAEIGRKDIRSEAAGSRFTALNDLTEEEGDKDGGTNMETTEGRGANEAPRVVEMVNKGKKPTGAQAEAMDAVELSVSDPSLLQGVKSSMRSETGKKEEPKKSLAGWIKDRVALREVSNILEAQPINFKSNRIGLKIGRGSVTRERLDWLRTRFCMGGRPMSLAGLKLGRAAQW